MDNNSSILGGDVKKFPCSQQKTNSFLQFSRIEKLGIVTFKYVAKTSLELLESSMKLSWVIIPLHFHASGFLWQSPQLQVFFNWGNSLESMYNF